jgi:hypothetical protein
VRAKKRRLAIGADNQGRELGEELRFQPGFTTQVPKEPEEGQDDK